MKKIYILLMLIAASSILNAQNFTGIWRKTTQPGASDFPWLSNTNGLVRTIAYNATTNHVYVGLTSSTATGDSVFILNATNGTQIGKLRRDGTAIGNEPFKNLRIRVSSDGAIYSSSLSVADGTIQRCKIYRWASEADTATLASSFVTTERCGDALAIIGSGINTKLFVAGPAYATENGVRDSSAQKIYILTTVDGLVFTKTDSIRLISTITSGAQPWIRSLDAIGDNITDGFWVNNQGRTLNRIDVVGTPGAYTASIGFSIPAGNGIGQASNAYASVKYLKTPSNKKYVAMAGVHFTGITRSVNSGVVMRMVEVTDEANLIVTGTDTLRGVNGTDTLLLHNTNVNSSGDVAFKDNANGSYDVFYLSTNNGIACTRSATTLPVEFSYFNIQLLRNTAKLVWNTNNEINNAGFEIEKSTNGIHFNKIGFVKAKDNIADIYEYFDEKAAQSKASTLYYRLKQLDKDGKFSFSAIKTLKLPSEKSFSLSLLENPIKDEIKLVVNATIESDMTINVTNNNGQLITNRKITVKQGVNNLIIPANKLARGVYYISVQSASEKQTLSILKQ